MGSRSVIVGATAVLLAGLSLSGCGGGSGSDSSAQASPDQARTPAASTSVPADDPNASVQASPGATTDPGHYAVTGTVKDTAGHAVIGVLVTAKSLAGQNVPELAVLTDRHGHYRWPSLQAGKYELLVRTYAGEASGQVTVTPAGPASLDLTLPS